MRQCAFGPLVGCPIRAVSIPSLPQSHRLRNALVLAQVAIRRRAKQDGFDQPRSHEAIGPGVEHAVPDALRVVRVRRLGRGTCGWAGARSDAQCTRRGRRCAPQERPAAQRRSRALPRTGTCRQTEDAPTPGCVPHLRPRSSTCIHLRRCILPGPGRPPRWTRDERNAGPAGRRASRSR